MNVWPQVTLSASALAGMFSLLLVRARYAEANLRVLMSNRAAARR
jgi:hypothetical protein